MRRPPLQLQTTTLWEYPSQNYGDGRQGDQNYAGATPSYIVWNLLLRYTRPKDLVVDPMAGSGTTLDVARDLGRRALGYDIQPVRKDIFRADARRLPLESEKADFVFVDPPYSDHIRYSGAPGCIGELPAESPEYFRAMEQVIREINRVLRPGRYMALYVSDSFRKGKPLVPIGFELFGILRRYFVPVDIVAVVRHNAKLERKHWHTAAIEGNYFLRGFNYLFILYKPPARVTWRKGRADGLEDRRDPAEVASHLAPRPPHGEEGSVPPRETSARRPGLPSGSRRNDGAGDGTPAPPLPARNRRRKRGGSRPTRATEEVQVPGGRSGQTRGGTAPGPGGPEGPVACRTFPASRPGAGGRAPPPSRPLSRPGHVPVPIPVGPCPFPFPPPARTVRIPS